MQRRLLLLAVFCLAAAPSINAGQDNATLSDSCDAYSGATVPRFRVAWSFVNHNAKATVLNVSVKPREASKEKIIALACKLRKENAKEQSLAVSIFDDHRAARLFGSNGQYASEAVRNSVRAWYSFDREKNSQQLTWIPDRNKPFNSIKIDLGAPPPAPAK